MLSGIRGKSVVLLNSSVYWTRFQRVKLPRNIRAGYSGALRSFRDGYTPLALLVCPRRKRLADTEREIDALDHRSIASDPWVVGNVIVGNVVVGNDQLPHAG